MSRTRPTASEFLSSSYDPKLEREFFGRVVLSNGIVKTTSKHRLDDVNHFVLPYLKHIDKSINIFDVAASSGVSTAEWSEQLRGAGISFSLAAGDLTVNALHVKVGGVEGLMDKQLNFIHLGISGRGMPPNAPFPLSIVTNCTKKYLRWRMELGAPCYNFRLVTKRPFSESIAMYDDDLSANADQVRSHRRYDVIRAANILNYAYFPEETLLSMIRNLRQRLNKDGLLLITALLRGLGRDLKLNVLFAR